MRKYEEMVRKYEATKELYKLAKVEREEGAEELEAFSIKYEKLEAAQTIKYDTFRDSMEQATPPPPSLLQPACCNHLLLQPYNQPCCNHPAAAFVLQPFSAVH